MTLLTQNLPTSSGSHIKVSIECDYKISNKCNNVFSREYRDVIKYRKLNSGKDICLFCSRTLKFSGRSNPNTKHFLLEDSLFSTIDTKEKAYVLGLIASDGNLSENTISISLKESDTDLLTNISKWSNIALPKNRNEAIYPMSSISFHSKQMVLDVVKLLGLPGPGKKSDIVTFPSSIPSNLYSSFLLGYLDGDGCISFAEDAYNYPRVSYASNSNNMITFISTLHPYGSRSQQTKAGKTTYCIEYAGTLAIDFLHFLYRDAPAFFLKRKYELYREACSWQPTINGTGKHYHEFKCVKTDLAAVMPSKTHASDSGYDLTLIKIFKIENGITYYDTGLKIQPPHGWWFSLVPRSSMAKSGYMLANTIGIIDRTYKGPILVALRKLDASMPDIELPAKLVQIIPIPAVHFDPIEVTELDNSVRDIGGFGSTDKKA